MKGFLGGVLFCFLLFCGAPAWATMTSGTVTSGSITAGGTSTQTFSGTTGDGIMLYADAAYSVVIKIYKPSGGLWTTDTNRAVYNNLPETGTYSVVLSGSHGTDSGSYDLSYVEGGKGVSNGSLYSGRTATATISENALVSYTFEGTAGQGVILQTDASYYAPIRAFKPDGSYWITDTSHRILATLPATGTYTVVVYGVHYADTGPFSLYYARGDDTVSQGYLVSGSARSGDLPENGLETYNFTAVSGNSLSITSTGSYNRILRVYKPDGSYWTKGTNSFSGTLSQTGRYMVAVQASTISGSGQNTVTVTTPPAPVAATDETKEQTAPPVGCDNPPQNGRGAGSTQPGVFPPANPQAGKLGGDPINFDVGYVTETAVDYSAGNLTFSRVYRSDSTWTDNTIGALWRTNYARTLTVGGGAASITDGTGATTDYTQSGSDWIPDDPDTTATFEDDGSGGYIYTLPNNNVEKYDSSGKLTRIEYLGGGALDLTYNGSGQLDTVTNQNGRDISFTYSSGRVATMVTPDGTFSYSYDGNGNLDTVTKPDTNTIQYHYENGTYVNALTGITDENGNRYSTFTYDANGKAIQAKLAGDVDSFDVAYNADDTSTTTNALGKDTTYYYANIQGVRRVVQVAGAASTSCAASNRYYNYDDLGRVISKTDWDNNTTLYEYDDRGNITKITQAAGTADERVTEFTLDSTFNLPDLITEPGRTTDYDYDTYGRLTSVTVTDTNTSETRITTYTYYSNSTDANGNLVLGRLEQVNGPRTDVTDTTDYAYDANLDLETVTNALSQVSTITARDSAGRPTSVEDANGVETDYVYDTNGRLQSATRAVGTGIEAETEFDYDDDGNLTKVTLPNGVFLEYSYDNARRLTGIEDVAGNTITYTLDDAGNITQEDINTSTPTLKYTHSQVFDELSRIIESVGASSQTAHYTYDANSLLTEYTDPDNNVTDYAYDPLRRLVTQTDALMGVETLGYNALGNMDSAEDQRGNTTSYTYNAFGDVTAESSPDRGSISYTVDKAGNVTSMTDARSVVTNYTWDALNRLTAIDHPSDSSLDADLVYDSSSGCGSAYKGHLCSVTDAAGTTAYQYDDLGRMTQATYTRNGHDLTVSYSYDLAGVLTDHAALGPDGHLYDQFGRAGEPGGRGRERQLHDIGLQHHLSPVRADGRPHLWEQPDLFGHVRSGLLPDQPHRLGEHLQQHLRHRR